MATEPWPLSKLHHKGPTQFMRAAEITSGLTLRTTVINNSFLCYQKEQKESKQSSKPASSLYSQLLSGLSIIHWFYYENQHKICWTEFRFLNLFSQYPSETDRQCNYHFSEKGMTHRIINCPHFFLLSSSFFFCILFYNRNRIEI